jgi:hypothetical protein
VSRASYLPLFLTALACVPASLEAPARPHPTTLRRDRLNRQRQHAHGRERR